MQKGDIYKAHYEGWYCMPCETFLTEKPDEKIDVGQKGAIMPDVFTRIQCIYRKNHISLNYLLIKIGCLQFYANNPDFIIPRERAHEVINFVKEGLRDLSISRTSHYVGNSFSW